MGNDKTLTVPLEKESSELVAILTPMIKRTKERWSQLNFCFLLSQFQLCVVTSVL